MTFGDAERASERHARCDRLAERLGALGAPDPAVLAEALLRCTGARLTVPPWPAGALGRATEIAFAGRSAYDTEPDFGAWEIKTTFPRSDPNHATKLLGWSTRGEDTRMLHPDQPARLADAAGSAAGRGWAGARPANAVRPGRERIGGVENGLRPNRAGRRAQTQQHAARRRNAARHRRTLRPADQPRQCDGGARGAATRGPPTFPTGRPFAQRQDDGTRRATITSATPLPQRVARLPQPPYRRPAAPVQPRDRMRATNPELSGRSDPVGLPTSVLLELPGATAPVRGVHNLPAVRFCDLTR